MIELHAVWANIEDGPTDWSFHLIADRGISVTLNAASSRTSRHRGKIIKTRCMCDRFHRDAICTRNTEVLPKNKTNASDRCRHTFNVDTAVQVHAAGFCVLLWVATKTLNVYCFHLQGRKWMK